MVEDLYYNVQEVLKQWTFRHYNSPGNHRKPQEVKKWMSKIVSGLILEAVIPSWHAETSAFSPAPFFSWKHSSMYLAHNLCDLLEDHDEGIVEGLEAVKSGVEFGRRIGMNVEGLFDGPLEINFRLIFGVYGVEKD